LWISGKSGGRQQNVSKEPFRATMNFHGKRENLYSRVSWKRHIYHPQAEAEGGQAPSVAPKGPAARRPQVRHPAGASWLLVDSLNQLKSA
jgi:hypothetical protein